MESAIRFEAVSKRFTLSHARPRTLQENLLRLLTLRHQREEEEAFWALKEVSFEVPRGRTVGLVGANGSGKSTALKLIAGILEPTEGRIRVDGRISALLELGAGMHPDLTGRENVFLNGTLLGLSNGEIASLYDRIVDFAELERFIDMQVKHYSSGMYMRLGFSVAVHARPDLLLLDEVLAVGDQSFQNKCLDRIDGMRRDGTTILMVSHSVEAVRDMCEELIWLREGRLAGQGPTAEILERYLDAVASGGRESGGLFHSSDVPEQRRWGNGRVEITAIRLRAGDGRMTDAFLTGEGMTVEMDYVAHEPVENPMFGIAIHRVDGTHVNGPNNKLAGSEFGRLSGPGTVRCTLPALPLLPGGYDLTVSAYDGRGTVAYDVHARAYPFSIGHGGTNERYGIVSIPVQWSHEAAAAERSAAAGR